MKCIPEQTGLKKIISGGQTGVDRGALDAALEWAFPCGGWCPEGRKAEDGEISDRYPVRELKGAGYKERTLKNVRDGDGTVIIYFGFPTGGTEETMAFCMREKKPYLLIDGQEMLLSRTSERIIEFIEINHISILNVAGPRASQNELAYEYAKNALIRCLNQLSTTNTNIEMD